MRRPIRISNVQRPTSNDQVGWRERFPRRGKLFSTLWKSAPILLAAICAAGAAEVPAPWIAEADWGPLAAWMVDADGNGRFRAAGPFWENAASPDGKKLAAFPRPLWARAVDPEAGRDSWDFCWPLASGKTFGKEKSWRAALAWYLDDDREDPASRYRFWLLPVWFHGRAADGAGYAALFPLGGEIRNFLFKDRIRFALWPLWAQSEVNDVRTVNVLWPIYSRTTTPDGHLEARRVFPLYARTKSVRQFEKTAILWPLWTHASYVHPKAQGTAWVLFPVAGRIDLTSQKGWMVLPPFFQFVRGEQLNRTYCPWPFFQRETGVREKLYVWPLYGFRKDGPLERRFWLWPLASREVNEFAHRKRTRWTLTPLWTCATETALPPAAAGKPTLFAATTPAPAAAAPTNEPPVVARRTKLWPLVSSQWDAETGISRTRLLDLWPAGRPPAVERSWAPLWTLLDVRANGANRDVDALWGVYRGARRADGARATTLFPLWRHERAGGDAACRWSVLKGLIAYDRTATNRQVRFLWLGRVRLAPANGKTEEPK